jgi:pilus assembly protein CpaE
VAKEKMPNAPITSAIISTDEEFRTTFREAAAEAGMEVVLDLPVPIPDVSEGHTQDLKKRAPDLIFVDLADEPDLGCELAQVITDAAIGRRLIGVGPLQSPEFLLAAMQSGIADYLSKPVTADQIVAAVERSRRALAPREAAEHAGELYAFFSPKGGGGATTIATNLAIQLHRLTGRRTALVDLDLELGGAALFLALEPRYSIVDLAGNLHRVDKDLLNSYMATHESGIDLLSAPYDPRKADSISDQQVTEILKFLKRHYDYVIVDCPKALTSRTTRVFERADGVYIVSQVDVPSIQNIQRSQPLFTHMSRGRPVRLIVNRYDPNSEITIDDLEHSVEMEVFWTVANDYDSVSYSTNSGKPLIMRPGSVCARELEGLAARIAGVTGGSDSKGRILGSVFGRLRGRFGSSPGSKTSEAYLMPPTAAESEGS